MDVPAGFENCNGRVGVVGEYHVIARFLQFDLEDVPDQEFIFNDKDSSHVRPPPVTRREIDNSSNPWKGSIVPPWRGDRRGAKTRDREQSCPSSQLTRNEVACAHEVLWQSRPASSTMPTAAI